MPGLEIPPIDPLRLLLFKKSEDEGKNFEPRRDAKGGRVIGYSLLGYWGKRNTKVSP